MVAMIAEIDIILVTNMGEQQHLGTTRVEFDSRDCDQMYSGGRSQLQESMQPVGYGSFRYRTYIRPKNVRIEEAINE